MTEVFMSFIKADNICRNFGEGFSLKNISFEIDAKGIYGFLGKKGAGCSSLAKVLAGAADIDDGALLYNNGRMYVSARQDALMKGRIGYVAEKPVFDGDATVFEALDLVGKAKKVDPDKRFRQIKEALEITGLTIKSDVLTEELSLSERKRLAIAASLLGGPEVLIFDEPLRFLDARESAEIKSLIAMLKSKKVVLIFSSRPDDIGELCGQIGIMSRGELVLWQSAEELLSTLKENGLGGLSAALEAFSGEEK